MVVTAPLLWLFAHDLLQRGAQLRRLVLAKPFTFNVIQCEQRFVALLSQYLPDQARALNAGELSNDPQDWVMHKVTQVLDDYHAACYPEVR